MSTPVTSNPTSIEQTTAHQRWEKQSPRYKKDLAIQIVATAALATLALAIAAGGIAFAVTLCPPNLVIIPVIIACFVPFVLTGGSIASAVSLGPSVDYSIYKRKHAQKLCNTIRKNYIDIPVVSNLGYREIAKESDDITNKLKAWNRYGFITQSHKDKLLAILSKDETVRKRLTKFKTLVKSELSTKKEIEEYHQKIEKNEAVCDRLKQEWRSLMEDKVFPDLPFS